MMKTLNFIVLLTVMLVNVTPYIKDGKVEWKANEVAAQYYTIENTGLGFWICGSYDDPFITVVSRVDCYDLLPSQVSDEEAEFEDCFCGACGYQKEYCQEPCVMCLGTTTVDEDGNNYNTGESICKCLCGAELENCSGSYCSNIQCPYTSLSSINYTITIDSIPYLIPEDYPCIWERDYSYKMDVYPLQGTCGFSSTFDESGNETIHNNWCAIFVLATVIGDENDNICTDSMSGNNSIYLPRNIASNYSTKFKRDIVNDSLGVAVIHERALFIYYGITIDTINFIPHDGCEIFNVFKYGNSKAGIFVEQSKKDTGLSSGHALLLYGIEESSENELEIAIRKHNIHIYNTYSDHWDTKIPLEWAENIPGIFRKITK